jgi:hypothetical protein
MSASIVVSNPLRKAINLEKTRKRINTNIEQLTTNFQKERQYIINNPGVLPNVLSAAHRRMLSYNEQIAKLKHKRNNLHGGRKRKTQRK